MDPFKFLNFCDGVDHFTGILSVFTRQMASPPDACLRYADGSGWKRLISTSQREMSPGHRGASPRMGLKRLMGKRFKTSAKLFAFKHTGSHIFVWNIITLRFHWNVFFKGCTLKLRFKETFLSNYGIEVGGDRFVPLIGVWLSFFPLLRIIYVVPKNFNCVTGKHRFHPYEQSFEWFSICCISMEINSSCVVLVLAVKKLCGGPSVEINFSSTLHFTEPLRYCENRHRNVRIEDTSNLLVWLLKKWTAIVKLGDWRG